jgi:hypothetical protein
MAVIDFPASPTINQIFAAPNGVTYKWTGLMWVTVPLTAPINSPVFTGNPQSTTPPPTGDADNSIPTTSWVRSEMVPRIGNTNITGGLDISDYLLVKHFEVPNVAGNTAYAPLVPYDRNSYDIATTAWVRSLFATRGQGDAVYKYQGSVVPVGDPGLGNFFAQPEVTPAVFGTKVQFSISTKDADNVGRYLFLFQPGDSFIITNEFTPVTSYVRFDIDSYPVAHPNPADPATAQWVTISGVYITGSGTLFPPAVGTRVKMTGYLNTATGDGPILGIVAGYGFTHPESGGSQGDITMDIDPNVIASRIWVGDTFLNKLTGGTVTGDVTINGAFTAGGPGKTNIFKSSNNANLGIYSDTVNEIVVEAWQNLVPTTKYDIYLNKYGGWVKTGALAVAGVLNALNGIAITGPNLQVPAGSLSTPLSLLVNDGNIEHLNFYYQRTVDGGDWTSTRVKIERVVDATPLGYFFFEGTKVGIGWGSFPNAFFVSSNGYTQFAAGLSYIAPTGEAIIQTSNPGTPVGLLVKNQNAAGGISFTQQVDTLGVHRHVVPAGQYVHTVGFGGIVNEFFDLDTHHFRTLGGGPLLKLWSTAAEFSTPVTGAAGATFAGDVRSTVSAYPKFIWRGNGNAVDQKVWQSVVVPDGRLLISALNDAENASVADWQFYRNGNMTVPGTLIGGAGFNFGAGAITFTNWFNVLTNNAGTLPPHGQGMSIGWNYVGGTATVDYVNNYASNFGHKFWAWNATFDALIPAPVTMGDLTAANGVFSVAAYAPYIQIQAAAGPGLVWNATGNPAGKKFWDFVNWPDGNMYLRSMNDVPTDVGHFSFARDGTFGAFGNIAATGSLYGQNLFLTYTVPYITMQDTGSGLKKHFRNNAGYLQITNNANDTALFQLSDVGRTDLMELYVGVVGGGGIFSPFVRSTTAGQPQFQWERTSNAVNSRFWTFFEHSDGHLYLASLTDVGVTQAQIRIMRDGSLNTPGNIEAVFGAFSGSISAPYLTLTPTGGSEGGEAHWIGAPLASGGGFDLYMDMLGTDFRCFLWNQATGYAGHYFTLVAGDATGATRRIEFSAPLFVDTPSTTNEDRRIVTEKWVRDYYVPLSNSVAAPISLTTTSFLTFGGGFTFESNVPPTITQGVEVFSQTFTPIGPTRRTRVRTSVVFGNSGAASGCCIALYLDGATDAIASSRALVGNLGWTDQATVWWDGILPAGAHTFSVRVMANTANTHINGSGAQMGGASQFASMLIEEVGIGAVGPQGPPGTGGANPVGVIIDFAGLPANIPSGYVECDGQVLNRTTFATLYAALGGASSPWGQGDNSTTFNVPDLRGRLTISRDGGANRVTVAGSGVDATAPGKVGGNQYMPSHAHVFHGDAGGAPGGSGYGLLGTGGNPNDSGIAVASAGSGSAANMPPLGVVIKIIRTT